MSHAARLAVRFLLTVCLIGLGWGGWYVYTKGFGRSWRQFVTSEFHKRGVEVSIRRLTLDPFKGLVARDVQIVDERGHALAVINRLILDINYSNLVRRKPFLDAVDLRHAKLDLPIDSSSKDSPRVRISGLNAHLQFPPHQVYLPHAEADVYGIHITATGRLINPDQFRPAPPAGKEQKKTRSEWIAILMKELKRLRYQSEAPRLDLRVTGDLAHPEAIFGEATFWGEKIEREGYRLNNLYAAVTLRDGLIDLKRCSAADDGGALDGNALYDMKARTVQFQFRSTLDLQAIARSARLGFDRGQFVLRSPPSIEVAGTARFLDTFELSAIGHISTGKFSIKSVAFEALSAGFSLDGGRWFVRRLRAIHSSGEVTADAIQLPGDFRLRLQSTLNPKVLLPLLPAKAVETLEDWDFPQPPDARWEVRGTSASNPGDWDATGEVHLRHSVLRGVPLDSAVSKVLFKEGAFTCEDFKVERPEGSASGTFTYDFRKHEARLTGIKSALNTGEASAWIDPDLVQRVAPYRFKSPPNLSINGLVQFGAGKNTNLEILVDAPAGMDYVFLKRNLSASSISGRLLFTDDRLRIFDLDAAIFGGRLQGGADISLARKSQKYTAQITAQDIDFEQLTKLYFDYDGSRGMLDGEYNFGGIGEDPRTMQGHGSIKVANGNVFAIPILGPLSGVLNGIVPGMGYNLARKASSTFEVQDGTVETKDFVVDGKGFNMFGAGKIDFSNDKMDFDIRLDAAGIPGTLLFPVSKLFEYTSTGSLSKPAWRLKLGSPHPNARETPKPPASSRPL